MTTDSPILVIDGHNDLAWTCRTDRGYSVDGIDRESKQTVHTDIPKARRGGLGGQFWSVWVDTAVPAEDQVLATLEQIDFVYRMVARYPDALAIARTADDVERAFAGGRIASLMGIEGSHQLGGSLAALRVYSRLGVRYMTLTWNSSTEFADANIGEVLHEGLSDRGRELVAEMNRIGMLVDLSHVSPATMHDALDATTVPVIFSHSSCHAVNPHPRNVPDDVMTRLATNGGVQMITFVPQFVSHDFWEWEKAGAEGTPPPVTLNDVVTHVEHARETMGVDHVGIGADYDGFSEPAPSGLEDVSGYPRLLEALRDRNWSDDDLSKLAHRNILRVLRDSDH